MGYYLPVDSATKSPPEDRVSVSVVIPHRAGRDILLACLGSLNGSLPSGSEVIVVDTGCRDGSIDEAQENFPEIAVVDGGHGAGFSQGCNQGIRRAKSPWILLLNDDAVLLPGCVDRLLQMGEKSPDIGAVQPKILSAKAPEDFDAAGAAGGFIDRYGHPFARGRLFHCVEQDRGQYDTEVDLFWGAGVCLLIRRKCLDEVGDLDESFFAHMEEIDFCWRMGLAGWRTVFAPEARTLHVGGATLARGSARKIFLNHRNGLWMMIKNLSARSLVRVLPFRAILDLAAVAFHLVNGRPKIAAAVLVALGAAVIGLPKVITSRSRVQRLRTIPDRDLEHLVLPRSVAIAFFVHGVRSFEGLSWKVTGGP
jgi:hypothetical protein